MQSMTFSSTFGFGLRKLLAVSFIEYPSVLTASQIRALVFSEAVEGLSPDSTLETVEMETPASFATSFIVLIFTTNLTRNEFIIQQLYNDLELSQYVLLSFEIAQ